LGEAAARGLMRHSFMARVEAHPGIVHKVARAYCWSIDDRDDLVQDILAQAWRAYPSYDPARPFSTWLYRVALNVAISWVRNHVPRQRVTVPLDPDLHDAGSPPFDPVAAERVRSLTEALRQLEPLDRALVLLYLDDHSHRDIAAVLGLSETNVATKLHRLKQRLRRRLETLA
jgi:RNA polymerase sigma factor (sigma-70 family)